MSIRGKTKKPRAKDDGVQSIQEIRSVLFKWSQDNFDDFPWRSSDNPFHVLIAELMLQRTRAEQVVPVYNKFTARYPSIKDAAETNPDEILELLKPLGLEWRARNIVEVIQTLFTLGGIVPSNYDELKKLSGVGDYIASAFLSMHTGERAIIIDSNVVRIWGRIFGFETDAETRRKKWFKELAEKMTPSSEFRVFNYAVLDFSRKICKAKPLCMECPLRVLCSYFEELSDGQEKEAKSDI